MTGHFTALQLCSPKMLAGKTRNATTTEAKWRTGDERLVKLTEAAAGKVSALLQRQGRPEGVLRVAVMGGGCSGLQWNIYGSP